MKKVIIILCVFASCFPLIAKDNTEIIGKYYCSNVAQNGESGVPDNLTMIEIKKDEFCTAYPSYSCKKCEYVWDEKDNRYYIFKIGEKDRSLDKASFVEVATQMEGKLPSAIKVVFHGEKDEPEMFDRVKDVNEAKKLFSELKFGVEYGQPPYNPDYVVAEYIKRKSWWPDIEIVSFGEVEKSPAYGYKIRVVFIPIGKYLNKLNKTCYDFYFKDGYISTFKKVY